MGGKQSGQVTDVSRTVEWAFAIMAVVVGLGIIALSVILGPKSPPMDEAYILGTYRLVVPTQVVAFLILRQDGTYEEAHVPASGNVYRNSGRWSLNTVDRPQQVILENSLIDRMFVPSFANTEKSWKIGFEFAPTPSNPVGTITLEIDNPYDSPRTVLKKVSSEQTVPETWNAK